MLILMNLELKIVEFSLQDDREGLHLSMIGPLSGPT